MKDLAAKAGRSSDFEIASAAVSREEIGNGVYPPARQKLAQHGIFLFAFSYLFSGVNTFATSLFSALNKGMTSAFMACMNTFVFLTSAMFLLPKIGLGADGVWLAAPMAEMLSLCLTVFLLKKNQKQFGY